MAVDGEFFSEKSLRARFFHTTGCVAGDSVPFRTRVFSVGYYALDSYGRA